MKEFLEAIIDHWFASMILGMFIYSIIELICKTIVKSLKK